MPARKHTEVPSAGQGWLPVVCGAWLLGLALEANASEVRVLSRTVGEGYVIRAPGPDGALLDRRRLSQYVNLGVYELLPPKRPDEFTRDPMDGQLQVVASLRLRHDFGDYARTALEPAATLVAGLDGRQIDLLFGYIEGLRLGGFADVRLGRQFEMSGLDFYVFDGASVRVHMPAHLALDAVGGFQVDGGAVFGYATFEPDGTQGIPSDRAISPMVGAGLELDGIPWAEARVAYRRTWSPADLGDNAPGPDGGGPIVDQEFVSLSLAFRFAEQRVSPFGAGRYNLGTSTLDDLSTGIVWRVTPIHSVRAQYLRTIPSFDLDSIFNVFAIEPFEDVRVVYEVRPGSRWTLMARFQGRFFRSATTADLDLEPSSRRPFGGGGGLAASVRLRRFGARCDAFGLGGEGGLRVGGRIDTRTHVWFDRLAVDARAVGAYYRDEIDERRRGYNIALQAGLSIHLAHGINLQAVAEELFTPLYRHAFRAFGSLTLDWAFRVGQR